MRGVTYCGDPEPVKGLRVWLARAALAALFLAGFPAALAALFLAGLPLSLAHAAAGDPAVVGRWSGLIDLGVKGISSVVLPNGSALLFSYPVNAVGSDAYLFSSDPMRLTDISLSWTRDIYCSGHSFLPDGRLFIAGGHLHRGGRRGVRDTALFDPRTLTFTPGPLLSEERWYPTNAALGNGKVLVFGGFKDRSALTKAVTVDEYDPVENTITQLPPTANRAFGNYPRLHLLRNGKIAHTNWKLTHLFNPATNTWSASASMNYIGRGESSASVLLPGSMKVLQFGGTDGKGGATNTAEIVDFSAQTPAWRYTASMTHPRVWTNAVLLPDGNVLAVGGGTGGSYTNPVYEAELYNPGTGTWTAMAAQQAPRVYHSTAVLLPDGRVLSAGHDKGAYQTTGEIYSPPYLFKGPRPTITSAPTSVDYGQTFTVSTPDARSITRVALIRPSSVTHSLHADQRYVDLSFTALDANTLSVTAPGTGNEAPPGPYMLFVLASGVPSVASWVFVGTAAAPIPPTVPPPPVTPRPTVSPRGSSPELSPPTCRCLKLKTRTSRFADFTPTNADRTAFRFRVHWTLNCAGRGGNCRGAIGIDAPRGLKLTVPRRKSIDCKGRCRGRTAVRGSFRVAAIFARGLDAEARAGRKFTFRFRKYCIRNGRRAAAGRGYMTVRYGPRGLISRRASDLNGDRKPDGRRPGRR
jgi:galactose oxidase-like protein